MYQNIFCIMNMLILVHGSLVTYVYITTLNTDKAGESIINEFYETNGKLNIALQNQNLPPFAKLLRQVVIISKAWLPHITNKRNQITAVQLIDCYERLLNKGNCRKLTLDDISETMKESAALSQKFIKELTFCCKC